MNPSAPLLRILGAGKTFDTKAGPIEVLRQVNLDLVPGRLVAMEGPSGSGKTTLLHLAALLDVPSAGRVEWEGRRVERGEAANLRRDRIGMVFQRFHLLPHRTALQNVLFRFRYRDLSPEDAERLARAALHDVGLDTVADIPARLLSGGEMQRVAIARALAASPRLLLADEPTGNLDGAAGGRVMDLLETCRDRGIAVLVATHNPEWHKRADDAFRLDAGRLVRLSGFPSQTPRPVATAGLRTLDDSSEPADRLRGLRRVRALGADVRDGLRTRIGRTCTAAAGIAIGWFALALALGVLRGLHLHSERIVAELGAHSAVLAKPVEGQTDRQIRRVHLEGLRASVTESAWSGAQSRILDIESGRSLRIVRTDEWLAEVRGWTPRKGRWLDAADIRDGSRHAVATRAALQAMGWNPGDAILLENTAFRLVGALDPETDPDAVAPGLIWAGEPAIFVSWTAVTDPAVSAGALDAVYVRARDERGLRLALRAADRILSEPASTVSGAAWITPERLLRGLRRWRDGIAWGSGSLALLCLLLGGTSLMNLLISDVRNRMPEIGLRMSLGARPSDLAGLFVSEACCVSLAAAAVALLGAFPALAALARHTGMPFEPAPGIAVRVALAAILFAVLFSLFPARLASRVSAAEALRND